MKVEKTSLPGVLQIKLEMFEDHRGRYAEIYNEKLYQEAGINVRLIQDDISVSTRHVLRGIHGDDSTWKLISCLHGKFYLVVVNCDKLSESYGKWQSFVLSETNGYQVLVPPKHGNGHLVLSESTIFHYKQSTYYNPKGQFTYKWDDPGLKIWWPTKDPILSQRDEAGRFVVKPA